MDGYGVECGVRIPLGVTWRSEGCQLQFLINLIIILLAKMIMGIN